MMEVLAYVGFALICVAWGFVVSGWSDEVSGNLTRAVKQQWWGILSLSAGFLVLLVAAVLYFMEAA